jgi:hypothetical protein
MFTILQQKENIQVITLIFTFDLFYALRRLSNPRHVIKISSSL